MNGTHDSRHTRRITRRLVDANTKKKKKKETEKKCYVFLFCAYFSMLRHARDKRAENGNMVSVGQPRRYRVSPRVVPRRIYPPHSSEKNLDRDEHERQ